MYDECIDLKHLVDETDYENGWTSSTQERFEHYLKLCNLMAIQNGLAQSYFTRLHIYYALPSFLFSTLAAFFVTRMGESNDVVTYYFAVVTSMMSVLVEGVHNILGYQAKSMAHNKTAFRYGSLAREIEGQLFMKPKDRDSPKFNFEITSRDFNTIASEEPMIPDFILKKISMANL